MAISSSFSPGTGVLTTLGDALDNTITTSRDAAGSILINGGAVPVQGGQPTVANTSLIQAFGQAGNDTIALDEANGALPAALLFGGDGNDVLTGGSGADQLFGDAGNDTLLGKGGDDVLHGGDGNDTLTGGTGNDQVFGDAGDDRMIWNPGEGSDLFEGGAGADTAEVNGGNGAETFTIAANNGRVRFDRTNPAPFTLDIGTTENLVINANGGDDVITAGNGLSALTSLTIDGGTGNDTITGGDGADTLLGGDGNDTVIGGRGNDAALLGAGDDVFVWNPGDGSDTVEGQAGADTLLFNGANVNENIDISANGGRVRFSRDVANITMDVNGVEDIRFNALGGADNIVINDVSGTDLKLGGVVVDLEGAIGSGTGDGQSDRVAVAGTAGNDTINVVGANGTIAITGASAPVSILHSEATDQLTVTGGAGADNIVINDVSGTDLHLGGVVVDLEGTIGSGTGDGQLDRVTVDGTAGNDTINVSSVNNVFQVTGASANVAVFHAEGNDQLVVDGGAGNDTMTGSQGGEFLLGGAGNDTITGGQGNDVLNGGAGNDTIIWNAGDGSDLVDGGDGIDALIVNGGNAAETITITANGGRVRVDAAPFNIDAGTIEAVEIHAGGGDDVITAGNGLAAIATLTIDGGAGNDTITGGDGGDVLFGADGNDTVIGGRGNDVALLGAGNDVFVWNPGDGSDVVEGEAGVDRLDFNGANASESIDISANGTRARLFRDVGSVTMDLNAVEAIELRALGGADNIVINDVSGTDLHLGGVVVDLEGTIGSGTGDGQLDRVTVDGTAGNDTINVSSVNNVFQVTGASANVAVFHAEGNDQLVVDGGAGNDTMTGSQGGEFLLGGAGNDTITGGQGNDVLNGGAGNDTIIWNAGDGSDLVDGGDGIDALIVNGGNAAETITITANGGRVRVDAAPFNIDAGTIEAVEIHAGGGDDVITAGNGLAAIATLTIDGGAGNDTITGGDGGDVLFGADGNDTVIGGRGNDVALLGAGNDVFVWNPGDGSDVVEGEAGVDRLDFNGANASESIDISANGTRARLFRDVANITMDVNDTETIDFHALGGADTITVNDLTGTDVSKVKIDLAAAGGGGDGQVDTIVINATNGNDAITVSNNNGVVTVSGLAAEVTISGFEATDRIVINSLAGDDVITASALTGMQLTADGGDGNDVLVGSAGNDTLLGGAGDDVLNGGAGLDILDGGPGNNILIQSPTVAPANSGTLSANDGSQAASLALLSQFMASSFVTAGDGNGGTPISDPPSNQQPLLTQPHA